MIKNVDKIVLMSPGSCPHMLICAYVKVVFLLTMKADNEDVISVPRIQ